MKDPYKKLLTANQLSEYLGVPRSWVYGRTRQGTKAIPFIRLGAYVRFDLDKVMSFFENGNSAGNGVGNNIE